MTRILDLRGGRRHCVAIIVTGGRRRPWTAYRTARGWVAEPRDRRPYSSAEAAEVAALVAAATAAEVAA